MKNIEVKSRELIKLIDGVVLLLLINPFEDSEQLRSMIIMDLMEICGDMMVEYTDNDTTLDILYWKNQLERMLYANERGDVFFLMDVLYFETKNNLLLMLGQINQKV